MELKVITHSGTYYSNSVNNRPAVYSFSNVRAAQNCCMYLANFKSRYSEYPYLINNNTPIKKLKLLEPYERVPVKYLLNEFEIEIENSEDLLISCNSINIGLILIDQFNYLFLDNEINVKFVGCDLLTKDVFEYNYLELI